jgi:hypothetical protein
MTASVGREVDANLLRGAAPGSAQTPAHAQDAGGKDVGDFVQTLSRGHQVGWRPFAPARRATHGGASSFMPLTYRRAAPNVGFRISE